MKNVQNTTAIITGGGSGIGRATSVSLAQRGSRVIVADLNKEAAESVAEEIRKAGGEAAAVYSNVGEEDAFEQLKSFALQRYGRIDIIMNNVGVLTRGLPDYIPMTEWQRIITINLLSVVRSNTVFLPLFLAQGSGHIVNTASFAGLYTYAFDRMPYAATKAAIIQISEGLALYLRPQGIGVTVLCPGPVKTNIMASLPPTFGPEVETRGPGQQFQLLEPEVVGEQVAEAIQNNTFMLYTHEQVRDLLVERAQDWNAFIDRQIEQASMPFASPSPNEK